MQDQPSVQELVSAVRSFIQDVAMPQLIDRAAFHARVAANALGIVERELEIATKENAAEHERLRVLLGSDANLEELNRELCRRIRSGELDMDAPGLVDHLRKTTLTKVAIDQPKYSGYRRALENLQE